MAYLVNEGAVGVDRVAREKRHRVTGREVLLDVAGDAVIHLGHRELARQARRREPRLAVLVNAPAPHVVESALPRGIVTVADPQEHGRAEGANCLPGVHLVKDTLFGLDNELNAIVQRVELLVGHNHRDLVPEPKAGRRQSRRPPLWGHRPTARLTSRILSGKNWAPEGRSSGGR